MNLNNLIGEISLLPEDYLLEIIDTQPGTDENFLGIGLLGFYYFDGENWQAFRYSEIKSVEKPSALTQASVIHLATGIKLTLPIKDVLNKFRNAYRSLLLDRAIPI